MEYGRLLSLVRIYMSLIIKTLVNDSILVSYGEKNLSSVHVLTY